MDLTVRHSRGAYPVRFCSVREALGGLSEAIGVTDQNVARAWPIAAEAFKSLIVVPPGEGTKSMTALAQLLGDIARAGATRKTLVVALGGGVVGDLAGFAAAVYARGLSCVQIPTSLLAMVDSSVGGKVGIDLPEGKNLAGAFWPPLEVRVATQFLETLPEPEHANGMAEVWKYGAALDARLFEDLEHGRLETVETVSRCIAIKARVVEQDEHETTGLRATLNFGHTVGHAIEAEQAYEGLSHGQAVSVGMVYETVLGERLGLTPAGLSPRIARAVEGSGLPTRLPPGLDVDALLARMWRDKKATGTGLSFSLLTSLGTSKLQTGVSEQLVRDVLENG